MPLNLHKDWPPNKARPGLAWSLAWRAMLALFVGAAAAAAALSLSDAATTCIKHATTVINFEFALKLVSEHVHLGSPHTRTQEDITLVSR